MANGTYRHDTYELPFNNLIVAFMVKSAHLKKNYAKIITKLNIIQIINLNVIY